MKRNISIYIAFVVILLALDSCAQQDKKDTYTLKGYDLSALEKTLLPEDLLEVSGIAFAPGEDSVIYAQQDEDGIIYQVSLSSGKVNSSSSFGESGDYEDISILKDTVLLLRSDGKLYAFLLNDLNNDHCEPVNVWKKVVPSGEYEGLFADSLTGSVWLLCKSCKADQGKGATTLYQMKLNGNEWAVVEKIKIDNSQIAFKAGKKKVNFRPSALARHPLTHEVYMLSSVNKMIVVMDKDWNVQHVCLLHPRDFVQPEGIAFDRSGNLYVSHEGSATTNGNIIKLTYQKKP